MREIQREPMDVDRMLLGTSAPIRAVKEQIRRVAPTEANVLIVGESGSGKELVARAIHAGSSRRSGPFVAINCGAIAAGLIEAELFGHEKGSFTGALQARQGVFERAHGGTLLLDEVTEMPYELQVRLLRILETGHFCRVGGSRELRADVRVLAATNRCPLAAVRDNRLREDLMYRLAVFPIKVPPLRERLDDIELLAAHFLECLNRRSGTGKRLSGTSLEPLRAYAWPGNVRELRNAVERAHILSDGELHVSPLADGLAGDLDEGRPATHGTLGIAVGASLHDAERTLIEATIAHCGGNKRRAAEVLDCSLKTLYNKVNGYRRSRVDGELQFGQC